MEYNSTHSPDFEKAVEQLLQNKEYVLALVRYPNAVGAKDYFWIKSVAAFRNLVTRLKKGDSLCVFIEFEIYWEGRASKLDINRLETYIDPSAEENWFFVSLLDPVSHLLPEYSEESFVDGLTALKEEIDEEYADGYLRIGPEPDFCDLDNTLHAYGPWEDGIGRAYGAY